MEEEEVIKEIEHDDNCFWSYVGSFLGALIGTIPWILLYYFYSFNLAILPALIPIMAVSGYKFFKGIVNEKTFRTIVIISIVVFVMTLFIVFPLVLANKEKVDFDEVKETTSYKNYSEKVLDSVSGELVAMSIGLLFAYAEISSLLKRYQATNNMIKDMNTFIRKDNNPIDGAEFSNGGIKFTDKNENPFYVAGEKTEQVSKTTSTTNNVWDEKKSKTGERTWSNRPYVNSNLRKTYNSSASENSKVVFIILVVLFIVPLMFTVFTVIAGMIAFTADTSDNSFDSTYHYYDDYDYDDYNDYWEYQYDDNTYTFQGVNIKLIIPDTWKIITEYQDNFLYMTDSDGYQKVLAILENDYEEENLEEIQKEVVEANIINGTIFSPIRTTMNGNETYYSLIELDNGNYSAVYTMKYQDYLIVLIDYETEYYQYYNYRVLLENIAEVQ